MLNQCPTGRIIMKENMRITSGENRVVLDKMAQGFDGVHYAYPQHI
jgi:hypothetical protein